MEMLTELLRNSASSASRSRCAQLLIIFCLCLPAIAATNFNQCFADFQNGSFGPNGGTDSSGRPANLSDATGITYDLCVSACGPGQEPFSWNVFSQQFSAWLLPWLALLSQLPFGAKHKSDNLTSVLLTVGSPTLAAYSLAITVLNGDWVARTFSRYAYPNVREAARILSALQQAPLRITKERGLLASLIVLPENDEWFKEMTEYIDFEYTWTIASATSIAWVVIAYLFTVVDSFSGIIDNINSNGQAVGSIWLWLIPIVIGWLVVAPKIESARLTLAMKKANRIAYVSSFDRSKGEPVGLAHGISSKRAFSLATETAIGDEESTAPIFNYARVLPWVQAVEEVATAYHHVSANAADNVPVHQDQWEVTSGQVCSSNRKGTYDQIIAYCQDSPRRLVWKSGLMTRFIVASLFAIFLQWGTTAASIIIVWYTPTKGLGCRSGSYIIYAIISTLVWFLMVTSAFLSHYSACREVPDPLSGEPTSPMSPSFHLQSFNFQSISRDINPYSPTTIRERLPSHHSVPQRGLLSKLLSLTGNILRRLGKILATLNASWLVLTCMFQFSSFFDRCYCNSDVLYFGVEKAFNVILPSSDDVDLMRGAWIGAVVMGLSSAGVFLGFVSLYAHPRLPD